MYEKNKLVPWVSGRVILVSRVYKHNLCKVQFVKLEQALIDNFGSLCIIFAVRTLFIVYNLLYVQFIEYWVTVLNDICTNFTRLQK